MLLELVLKGGFTKDKIYLMRRFLFFSVAAIAASLLGNDECSIIAAGIACWLNKALFIHARGKCFMAVLL